MTDKTSAGSSKEWFPCPFCGSPAIESLWPGHRGCSDPTCGAHMANLTMKQWNRRAALETPQPASNEWTRNDCEYDPVGAAREIARLYERAAQETCEQPKNWAVWQCVVHQRVFAAHAGCSYCREGRAPTYDINGNALKASAPPNAWTCSYGQDNFLTDEQCVACEATRPESKASEGQS